MSVVSFYMNGNGIPAEKKCELRIQKVGQEHCSPRKKSEMRVREYHSLHFILYGSGVLKYGEEVVHLNKGSAFLLYAGEEYEYVPDLIDPWSYVWVDFYADEADELFSACGFSKAKPHVHPVQEFDFVSLWKQLLEAYDASRAQDMKISAYFLLILSQLLENEKRLSETEKWSATKIKHVRNVLIYINNNYRLELTPELIAKENHLSVSYLMTLFSDVVGMSLTGYVNSFRISYACEVLKSSSLKIEEVARAVGFSDDKYFARVFKKIMGMTPREYRKAGAGDPFAWLKERNIDFR